MADNKINPKHIMIGLAVIIILVVIYYFYNKGDSNKTNAVRVKLASRYDGEIVQIDPTPAPLKKDDFGQTQVSRIVYQSGFGSYIDKFIFKEKDYVLAAKANVNITKLDNTDISLRASALDSQARPLYDYNPSSYATITPCVQDRKLYENNQCLLTTSNVFKEFYMQNTNLYSRMLFGYFKDVASAQQQNEVGIMSVVQTPTDVETINSIYLMFTQGQTFSPVGKYLVRYGKFNSVTKSFEYISPKDSIGIPIGIAFELKAGQNEVLIDMPPVKVFDPVTKKPEILFVEFRRVIENTSEDLNIYLSEILFNFRESFDSSKSELVKREFVNVSSIVDYGQDTRLREEVDNEENFCRSKGMQYLWTGDINTSRCVEPCVSDLDCTGDVYMEKENNSYLFVKLDEPKKCNGLGNLRSKQSIKYCTGVMPTVGPTQTKVPVFTL